MVTLFMGSINDDFWGIKIGLTPQTGSTEILRSVLESIAFSMKQLMETMENESEYASSSTIQWDLLVLKLY